jgi:GntR family transcriptional regulator
MAAKARVARYQEIVVYLRALIADAEPGARLPSEAELCLRFDVSRMTARHAVQILENESLVLRHRGRGTFVSPRRVPRSLGSPLSFTESMRARGLVASSEILEYGEAEPAPEDVDALQLQPGERVFVLERLRLANGVPMAIERAVLGPSLAGVHEDDLAGGSLHAAFERRERVPTRALATVTARSVSARERRLLDLPPNGVVLCERRIISDQNGEALEHTETCYAAERYEFESVLYRHETEVME